MTVRKACTFPAFGFSAAWFRGLVAVLCGWFALAPFDLPTAVPTSRADAQEAKPKDAPEVTWEQLIYVPYKQLSTVFEKQKEIGRAHV